MNVDPIELVALAIELEHEGQYNIAKLVRAAGVSAINRAAHTERSATDAVDQAAMLEQIADDVADSHASALADPLRVAARALRAGRVALVEEAPDPSVCRICGEVRLTSFDTRCPHCGRWPTAAERFRAIYWLRESTPPEALGLLRDAPVAVERLLGAGDDPRFRNPGPDGGWSAHQVLEHLNNAQSVFRGRIDQLIAGGDPELVSVMVWTIEGREISTPELVRSYLDLRSEIIELLEGVEPATWWNTGRHEEWGRVTLAEQASYFANHEPTHLGQLADAAR